jgi:hypothetical protein
MTGGNANEVVLPFVLPPAMSSDAAAERRRADRVG